jgi:hypothetical protein
VSALEHDLDDVPEEDDQSSEEDLEEPFILICRDGLDGWEFNGPEDTPIWDLYCNRPPGGGMWEPYDMTQYGRDLTVQQAIDLAGRLDLPGYVLFSPDD